MYSSAPASYAVANGSHSPSAGAGDEYLPGALSLSSLPLETGVVRWFSAAKGFGFIGPSSGSGPDCFVHQNQLQSDGFRQLETGQLVEYRLRKNDKVNTAPATAQQRSPCSDTPLTADRGLPLRLLPGSPLLAAARASTWLWL